MLSISGECKILKSSKKHAVSPHDLKKIWTSILSSKFKEFLKSYKHPESLSIPNKYLNFEKILIFLTHNRHIFEFLKFPKKKFFFQFGLDLQADLSVFLVCYKMLPILCATCPKNKIFIWDNTLVPKMIKSHLVCICGHVAHFFF